MASSGATPTQLGGLSVADLAAILGLAAAELVRRVEAAEKEARRANQGEIHWAREAEKLAGFRDECKRQFQAAVEARGAADVRVTELEAALRICADTRTEIRARTEAARAALAASSPAEEGTEE